MLSLGRQDDVSFLDEFAVTAFAGGMVAASCCLCGITAGDT